MEVAIKASSPTLATSCLQVFFHELSKHLNDEKAVKNFSHANKYQRSVMSSHALFSLYCLLSKVAMKAYPSSEVTTGFLEEVGRVGNEYMIDRSNWLFNNWDV